jgi:ketosteroid isomerase-like protein
VSEENVEVVRSAWEAWARRDNAAIFPLYDPDIEINDLFGHVYRGLDGVREWARDFLSIWDEGGIQVEELIDAGDNVVAVGRGWAKGKQSRVPVEQRYADVWTLRKGKLWRLRTYPTKADALKAVGLEEYAVPAESTTPGLVELARAFLEALSRRDFDAVERFYAPDAVFRGAEIGTFRGAPAIRSLLEDLLSPLEMFHSEIEEVLDLGNGVAFLVVLQKGRPAGISGEVQIRYASVVVLAGSVVERQTNYMDTDEGRAAAERLAKERG